MIDDLYEVLSYQEEVLGELESQHRAEVNHYGDSWPGAQLQIECVKQTIYNLKQQINNVAIPGEHSL